MAEPSASAPDELSDLIGELAESYTRRLCDGGRPDIEEFVQRHPQAADTIRQILPTLEIMRAAASDGLAPRNRDRYNVVSEHGRGGMGRVLEAHDVELGRRVALKELIRRTPELESRFFREAMITARLEHPGIVPIHDAGRDENGAPFYVMKMLKGESLKLKLASCNALVERFELLPELLAAVETIAFAHSRHVIHRDLKPANIMIGDYGETVVIDWGLAKVLSSSEIDAATPQHLNEAPLPEDVTAVGTIIGTPAYMAPEQAAGETADERSDVFALGAILQEILCGTPPGDERTPEDGVPRELIAIANKAMSTCPDDRYASAREFADQLGRFLKRRLVHSKSTAAPANHERVYGKPALYELAFSYRDIPAECAFLERVYRDLTGKSPSSFLDVAAGPGVHARCLAARGLSCSAIDSSSEMVRYGLERMLDAGLHCDYRQADMTEFEVDGVHDLGACMLDSLTYLHTNEAVIQHLQCTARSLRRGGLYVIELSHPVQLFRRGSVTRSTWEIEDDRGVLSVEWEPVEATFDPTTHCQQYDVFMCYRSDSGEVIEEIHDSSIERMFTFNEFEALVRASGVFQIMRVYGALDTGQQFSGDSWRMVPVLQAI